MPRAAANQFVSAREVRSINALFIHKKARLGQGSATEGSPDSTNYSKVEGFMSSHHLSFGTSRCDNFITNLFPWVLPSTATPASEFYLEEVKTCPWCRILNWKLFFSECVTSWASLIIENKIGRTSQCSFLPLLCGLKRFVYQNATLPGSSCSEFS